MFGDLAIWLDTALKLSGWTYIEWMGAFLGLGGSLIMASNRFSHIWAWNAWIISNILFISLFMLHTQQFGLLFMNIFGIFINLLGLWQWSKRRRINVTAMNTAFNMGKIGILSAVIILILFPVFPSIKLIEWFGAILSISGALLLASKHQRAAWSWIVWLISNFVLLSMTIYTKQWGVATLQLGFTISNIYGCIMWIYLKTPENKITTSKTPDNSIKT